MKYLDCIENHSARPSGADSQPKKGYTYTSKEYPKRMANVTPVKKYKIYNMGNPRSSMNVLMLL
jgi:hypothetical protein